tara:strand:+ start:488 stop:1090 length:603 start_codon:yes stop_codon:yes gene_type:complete
MKSFNRYIEEKNKRRSYIPASEIAANQEPIYPQAFLNNKVLMNLVKAHSDPYKFLLAVIDQMNRGKLKLRRIGAATTREVAALWNDFNNNKIPKEMMESVQLDEARKLAQVMWKDDMDFDNPEIQVFGLGVYTLKTLRKNIAMKLEDLAKRVETDSSWVWKQITDPKQIMHNLVGALYDAEEELNSSASKRKITMMKKKR